MRNKAVSSVLLIGGLIFLAPTSARATDGHFLHGVGAINSAMGGAGIAAPLSLLGAFYLNPAGLMAFDGTRVEFGFEMFKADRSVSSDAGAGLGESRSKSEFVPIPAMGWSTKFADNKVAVGVGALAIGGFGVDYAASTTNAILAPRQMGGFGQVYSNYGLMKITPAIAFAATDQLWLGFAANIDWASLAVDPMPIGAPAADPGPDGIPMTMDDVAIYSGATAADGAFGFGFQAGAIYRPNDLVSVGASFSSAQYFSDFEFNTTFDNPNLASFGTPRTIAFNMDVPMMVGAGLALKPMPQLLLASDFRYMFYEQTDGFKIPDGQSAFNMDGSVAGFGWQNIYSVHVGGDYRASDMVSLRAGYNFSQNPIPDSLAMINVPAPGIVQHHATVGFGIRPTRRFEISAAYYHAFENQGAGTFISPMGAMPGTTVENKMFEDSFLIQFSFATRGSM